MNLEESKGRPHSGKVQGSPAAGFCGAGGPYPGTRVRFTAWGVLKSHFIVTGVISCPHHPRSFLSCHPPATPPGGRPCPHGPVSRSVPWCCPLPRPWCTLGCAGDGRRHQYPPPAPRLKRKKWLKKYCQHFQCFCFLHVRSILVFWSNILQGHRTK